MVRHADPGSSRNVASYDHQNLEKHWQHQWEDEGIYRTRVDWERPKHYALTMLPYPSGDLHIGHWYPMTPSDARARFMRMKGYNVLFPMGFDAFGLPAENTAIKSNIHPAVWTWANIERMRTQLRSMGTMFDWEREVISADPDYYRWTEWFFKRFFDAGVAYRGEAVVNWSPTLQTVLANEQVIDGKDEREGQPVEQRLMSQWFFAITKYADELLSFEGLNWPEAIKRMQTNWVGRSEGADVVFHTEAGDTIPIFTTRPDTLWGATFMVLAPEHPLVASLTTDDRRQTVDDYVAAAARRTELERMEDERDKTGVFTGGYAVNPVNQRRIPVWVADYVLASYGSGAIMAVPAHDQRDFEFARKFGLEVRPVIHPEDGELLQEKAMAEAYVGPGVMVASGPIDDVPTNLEKGRKNPSVAATIDWLEKKGFGNEAIGYRLRDWLISRQRYWGAPIPVVYRDDGSIEAVPENELPVLLPEDVEFVPTGRSPLTYTSEFLESVDSEGQPARRETDTMDTFMCSSWYQYRYLSPGYDEGPFDAEEAAYWLPVDIYTGGAEHATMHLLYTRFFTKVMRDLGMFDETAEVMRANGRDPEGVFDEPMVLLRNQGQILGEERPGDRVAVEGEPQGAQIIANRVVVAPGELAGKATVVGELLTRVENILTIRTDDGKTVVVEVPETARVEVPAIPGDNTVRQLRHHLDVQRMSKTRGNTVNPDDLVSEYGADTVRTYMMFAFDWSKGGPWDSRGILGARRFIEDVWKLGTTDYVPSEVDLAAETSLRRAVHQAIDKVGHDMTDFEWNTAVATLMGLRNTMQGHLRSADVGTPTWNEANATLLLLLAPIAPHITDELWRRRGNDTSIHLAPWPEADADAAREDTVTMVIQVNGKVRDRVEVPADIGEAAAEGAALAAERIQPWLAAGEVRKVIVRPPNLVNIVVS